MITKKQFSLICTGLMITIAWTILAGCSPSTSTSDTQIIDQTDMASTITLEAQLPDQGERTTSTAIPSSTTGTIVTTTQTYTPSPTSTPGWPESCKPFPDHIIYFYFYTDEGASVCEGEFVRFFAPIGDGSPWNVFPWDYTSRTGRIAFGKKNPDDQGLWVYDFWTDVTSKWLDGVSLKEIRWAPVKNDEGIQPVAIQEENNTLSLVTEANEIRHLAYSVSHFSWSPDGDRIAFVKDQNLYSIPATGGEARLLARGVFGVPIWAPEDGVIFIVTSPTKYVEPVHSDPVDPDDPGPKIALRDTPLKIARLDGSGSFIPTSPDGKQPRGNSENILWVAERHLIVGDNFLFELSNDLKTILNEEFFLIGDMASPFDSILEYSRRLPIDWLLLPNGINLNLDHWSNEFHAIDEAFDSGTITLLAEVASNNTGSIRIIVILPGFGDMGYRMVSISEDTQIFDPSGNLISIEGVKKGMNIELVAAPLSEKTLSLKAVRIQILEEEKGV